MSKLTTYTGIITSIDSMGFPLQTEQDVYLASDVDALLSPPGEGLTSRYKVELHNSNNYWVLIDTVTGEEVGSDGGEPEDQSLVRDWKWVPELLNKLDAHLATQREEIERLTVDLDAAREAEEFLRDTPWLQENATLKAERATLQAELEGVRADRDMWQNSCEQSRELVGCLGHDNQTLQHQLAEITEQRDELLVTTCDSIASLAAREGQVKDLEEALEFYANPDTYFACAFVFDRPTGGFDEDFDEGHEDYDRPMPGKMARQALKPSA